MENKAVATMLMVASFISGIGGTIIVDNILESRAQAKREEEIRKVTERIFGNVESTRK